MAWLTTDADPIVKGWGPPPELRSAPIGDLVAAILRDKLAREKMTGESIADTIRNVRGDMQSDKYIDALKAAKLVPPDYEAGGMGGATLGTGLAKLIEAQQRTELDRQQQGYMEPYYRALTERAGRPDAVGGRGGTPRYPYKIPGTGETVDLTGGELARRRAEEATGSGYQGLLKSEAEAEAEMNRLKTKWGGLIGGKLSGAPAWPWQTDTTKAERDKDQEAYYRAQQLRELNRAQRELMEKRHPGVVGGAPAAVDTGQSDGADTEDVPGGSQPSAYASPDQIRMARARQALDDPQATPQEKEQARKILAGE